MGNLPPSVCVHPLRLFDHNYEYKCLAQLQLSKGGTLEISGSGSMKGKLSRALGFMTPVPRLTVLPPDEHSDLWTR